MTHLDQHTLYAEQLQDDDAVIDPLTGWQELCRCVGLIVGDAMCRAAPGMYIIGAAGALFWWLA